MCLFEEIVGVEEVWQTAQRWLDVMLFNRSYKLDWEDEQG